MKKKILLFTAVAALGYVALSSNSSGPAAANNIRNGVNGSTPTCGAVGCHGTGTTTGDSIRVDSAGGVAVSRYVAGMTYTITVTGWTTGTQTRFGFQYSAVKGTSPGQTQAGSFPGLPAGGINKVTKASIDYVEQNMTISTGTPSFTRSFTWTAPAASSGDVKMYLTVNAVDGNGSANSGDISQNYQKTLTELVSHAGVADIANGIKMLAYPNPMADVLNVEFKDMQSGTYTLSLYDMTGRVLSTRQVEVSGASHTATINTAGLAKGLYQAMVDGNGNRKVMSVVKE